MKKAITIITISGICLSCRTTEKNTTQYEDIKLNAIESHWRNTYSTLQLFDTIDLCQLATPADTRPIWPKYRIIRKASAVATRRDSTTMATTRNAVVENQTQQQTTLNQKTVVKIICLFVLWIVCISILSSNRFFYK